MNILSFIMSSIFCRYCWINGSCLMILLLINSSFIDPSILTASSEATLFVIFLNFSVTPLYIISHIFPSLLTWSIFGNPATSFLSINSPARTHVFSTARLSDGFNARYFSILLIGKSRVIFLAITHGAFCAVCATSFAPFAITHGAFCARLGKNASGFSVIIVPTHPTTAFAFSHKVLVSSCANACAHVNNPLIPSDNAFTVSTGCDTADIPRFTAPAHTLYKALGRFPSVLSAVFHAPKGSTDSHSSRGFPMFRRLGAICWKGSLNVGSA